MSHLPVQSTSFVGRNTEIDEISSMLAQDDCRLVSIVGAGGMGKTRLAIATAENLQDRYPDGVYFVDLASVKTLDGIVASTASVLDFNYIHDEVSPLEQLLHYLHDKRMLLILDNYEHLLDGADIVDEYLTLTDHIEIIVTAREPLNLDWEWLYQLRGMSFPESDRTDEIDTYSAVVLFEERARRTQRNFDLNGTWSDVVRICDLVAGMPLGLEMAAAWLNRVSCSQLADEIARNIDILKNRSRNVPDRHRSIRAVFDHSWSLLTDEERDVLVKLAVFQGGFTAEAAGAVTGANLWLLASLVDRSMVRQDNDLRYSLHPLLVQYLADMLNNDQVQLTEIRRRYTQYYYDWLEANVSRILYGEFFDEMLDDFDNIIQMWYWLVDNDQVDELEKLSILFIELFIYAGNLIPFAEEMIAYARDHFEPMAKKRNIARLLAKLLAGLFEIFTHTVGYDNDKLELRDAAYEYAVMSEDPQAIVLAGAPVNDKDEAFYQEMVDRVEQLPSSPDVDYAVIVGYIVHAHRVLRASYNDTLTRLQKALTLAREKQYYLLLTRSVKVIAFLNFNHGYFKEAEQYFMDAKVLAEKTRHPEHFYFCHAGLRMVNIFLKKFDDSRKSNEYCLDYCQRRNQAIGIREYYQFAALIEREAGNREKAISLFQQCLKHMSTYPASHLTYANTYAELAWIYFQADDYDSARPHMAEALRHFLLINLNYAGDWLPDFITGVGAEIILHHGLVALDDGELTRAVQLITASHRHALVHERNFLLPKTEFAIRQLAPNFPGRDLDEIIDGAAPMTIKQAFMQLTMPVEERPQLLVETISEREFDVLELLATGASNRDIARELFITLGTVKRHVHNISSKLGVENRTQVALKAKELGLVGQNP